MRRIYLDNCSLQRPHDDQTQVRIQLEAQAVLAIITLFEQGNVELISSETLHFEVERTPKSRRRKYLLNLLAEIPTYVETTDAIGHKAKGQETGLMRVVTPLELIEELER